MSQSLEDKTRTKKDNVRQEIDIEKDPSYNPPKSQNPVLGGKGGGGDFKNYCLESIQQHNYQFSEDEVTAIKLN